MRRADADPAVSGGGCVEPRGNTWHPDRIRDLQHTLEPFVKLSTPDEWGRDSAQRQPDQSR